MCGVSITLTVNEEQRLSVGFRFYLLFAAFTLLLFPVHEFGHYFTYRLLGVPLRMTLNTASPENQCLQKPIAELAGPLVNLVLATGAAFTYPLVRQKKAWLAALALAPATQRLAVYVLVLGVAMFTGSGMALGATSQSRHTSWESRV